MKLCKLYRIFGKPTQRLLMYYFEAGKITKSFYPRRQNDKEAQGLWAIAYVRLCVPLLWLGTVDAGRWSMMYILKCHNFHCPTPTRDFADTCKNAVRYWHKKILLWKFNVIKILQWKAQNIWTKQGKLSTRLTTPLCNQNVLSLLIADYNLILRLFIF
jgi:hypothetical protein